jgi:OPA family sugar phosphate sensor protein UhpC-like MFS transporter
LTKPRVTPQSSPVSPEPRAVAETRRPALLRFFATGPDAPPLQDPAKIDDLYLRSRRSILVAILFGYGFMYTCRLGINVVKADLIDSGVFTTKELGQIGSGLFYGYAFGRLVNGFLADHANLRRFFATGVLLSALANLVMGSTAHLWLWTLLWGLNGWFQGFGAVSSIVTISRWFGSHERGRVYGIFSASHSLGEGLTFVGTASLVTLWAHYANLLGPAWRAGFLGPGVFCLFVAVGIYLLMRDRPQTLGLPAITDWQRQRQSAPMETGPGEPACSSTASDHHHGRTSLRDQLEILKMPALWIVCLASATMYVTRYGLISWGMLYLQKERGYSVTESSGFIALNTAAGIGGCIAYGFISDLLFKARRPPVTLLFGIVEVLSLLVLFYGPANQPFILAGAFIVYGFTLSGLLAVLGGLFAVDIVPKKAAGAAVGLTGVFSYLFTGLQEYISAYLLHRGETVVNGVHHFDFSAAAIFWIGSSVVSMLLAASLWRTKVRD